MAEGSVSPVLDILRVVGPALALRVMTLPLLVKAQQAVRRQALADPATPPRSVPGAVVGELALGVAGGVGLWLLLRSDVLNTFHFLGRPVALETGGRLSDHYGYALGVAWFLYVVTVFLTSVVWPVLWARTQHTLLTTRVPGESWTSSPAGRFRLGGPVAVRIALGLLLPVGLALAAVVWQAVAYGVSRRYRHGAEVPGGGAPAPVLQAPVGQAPFGRTPFDQALADAPTAGPGPVRTAAPMPTRPDPVAGAVPHLAHQRLRPGEPSMIGGYHLLGRIGRRRDGDGLPRPA